MKSSRTDAGPADRALLERAAGWPAYPSVMDLTADTLRQITKREGVDFATALLFDRFQKTPARAEFIQRINRLRQNSSRTGPALDARVVIVPAALYVERPELGGDGRVVREVAASFGLETDLIPLVSFGSVAGNARLIRAWLEEHSRERIILVSLSKGGSDVKLALSAPDAPAVFRNVAAWINVCGPLNGSRMANWITASRLRSWFVRWKFKRQRRDFQFLTELRHGQGALLNDVLRLPASMKMLSVIGFPLKRHVAAGFSRFCHRILAAHGPNDGTTLLSDLAEWPGEIYPVWGTDHYFRPESTARSLIAAALQYLVVTTASPLPPSLNPANPQR